MKTLFAMLFLCGTMIIGHAAAQVKTEEHKHEDRRTQKESPGKSEKAPAKLDTMKCCEGMDKMGGMKEGVPMKAEMKAKMEKMKQKMAEKIEAHGGSGEKLEKKSDGAKELEKSPHQP